MALNIKQPIYYKIWHLTKVVIDLAICYNTPCNSRSIFCHRVKSMHLRRSVRSLKERLGAFLLCEIIVGGLQIEQLAKGFF